MAAWLETVRLATTGNLDDDAGIPPKLLTPGTLDGVPVSPGDEILAKDQTDPTLNGTWTAGAAENDPMDRRENAFVPEATVRVSEGARNAHTAWSLRTDGPVVVDADPLPWLRQDVKSYACDTIAELKRLTAVLDSATAMVSGYHARGDGGGGGFTFLGCPPAMTIIDAEVIEVAIDSVANSGARNVLPPYDPTGPMGIVTVTTAADHGLYVDAPGVASVFIDGDIYQGNPANPDYLIHGPFLVTVIDATTFTISGFFLNATLGVGGASIRYVRITTDAAHLRNSGEQYSVSGVVASGGAAELNGFGYRLGVIETAAGVIDPSDPSRNKLTVPIATSGGTYAPGACAVIGDDARVVTATDSRGTAGGVWSRDITDPANPRYFGARLNRSDDDLPALDAMIASMPIGGGRIYFPAGTAWTSDAWEILRPVRISGEGGGPGGLLAVSGIDVAPGKRAIVLSQGSVWVGHLELHSKILFNSEEAVEDPSFGVQLAVAASAVRKGDCFVDGNNAGVFFRALNAGTFGNPLGAWNDAVGDITTEGDVTLLTEAFPTVRSSAVMSYDIGSRVFADGDNRFFHECVSAGAPASGAPGQEINTHFSAWTLAGGVQLGPLFSDFQNDPLADLQWLPMLATAVHMRAPSATAAYLRISGFTGAAIHGQGGDESELPGNNANQCSAQDVFAANCGLGVYFGGTNMNGWTIDRLRTIRLADVPDPDAPGSGSYAFQDNTQSGGIVSGMYYELSSGVGVLKTGSGRTTFISCVVEGETESYFSDAGFAFIFGGSLVPTAGSTVTRIDDVCKNLNEYATSTAPDVTLHANVGTFSGLYRFASDDDHGNGYAFTYGFNTGPGFWGLQAGPNGIKNAFTLSTTVTELDPCPGWLVFDRGYLEGDEYDPASLRFNGMYVGAIDARLREGVRRPGDRFRDELRTYLVTKPGYRALPRSAITQAAERDATLGKPATLVEPSDNGPIPEPGRRVFYCSDATGDGEVGAVEPDWDAGPPVPDNEVEWTELGTTPTMVVTYGPGGGQHAVDITGAGPFELALDEAVNEFILLDGAPGGARTVNVPAPANDQEAYRRVIRNTTGQDATIGVIDGGVGTDLVPANTTTIVGFDSGGAFLITAPYP